MVNNRIIKSTSMAAIASMLVGTAFAAGVVPAYAGEVANNDHHHRSRAWSIC